MPAIADTDEEMQESAPAFLDAVVDPAAKGAAGKKEAGRATGASEGDKIAQAEQEGKEWEQEEEDENIAVLPDGKREKDVEAAEKIAEQETCIQEECCGAHERAARREQRVHDAPRYPSE
jgi:ATP-dependent phosphoenolpyruvate carboxykinase